MRTVKEITTKVAVWLECGYMFYVMRGMSFDFEYVEFVAHTQIYFHFVPHITLFVIDSYENFY